MPFLLLISAIISLYVWVVIIGVVLSWLMMFGIINSRNDFVQGISRFCYQLTEPALQRIAVTSNPSTGWICRPSCCCWGWNLCATAYCIMARACLAASGYKHDTGGLAD